MAGLDDMSLDDLQRMRAQRVTLDKAQQYGLDPVKFSAQMGRESGYNQAAVSPAGAIGVGQLLPGTAKGLGVDPNNMDQNIDGAARYMRQNLDQFGGDYGAALAAYHSGPGNARAALANPQGNPKTAAYVSGIQGASLDDLSLPQLLALRQQATPPPPTKQPASAAPSAAPVAAPKLTKAQQDAAAFEAKRDAGGNALKNDQSRALVQGLTFNFGDELKGLGRAAPVAVANMIGKGPGYTARAAYDATVGYERQRDAAYAKAHPTANTALGLAGGIINPLNVVGGEFVAGARGGQAVARAGVVGGSMGAAAGAGAGTDIASRAKGAAVGGAIGAGTGAALEGGGQLLAARSAARAANPSAARQLSQAGVQLTPGQMMGGIPKRIEDAATSLPFTGAAINGARRRGLQTFNRAAVNESLAPIGVQIQGNVNMARDSVRLAEQAIGDSYTQALAPVQGLIPDQQYAAEVAHIAQTPNLPADVQAELTTTLNDIQGQWTTPIDGQQWKRIDSQLGRAAQAADNASGTRPSMARLADALRAVRTAHQGILDRANPQAMAAVRNSDLASANFARVRQASQYVGTAARDGVFTPADLNRAVQGLDNSANNRAYARGDALGQQLSQNGQTVLPSAIPDSGTAIRGMLGLGAYGGTAGIFGGGVALKAAGADLAVSGLYSRPVQALVNQIYRAATPGQASGALARLSTLAARNPGLAPLYESLRAQLSGQGSGPEVSIPMQVTATQP